MKKLLLSISVISALSAGAGDNLKMLFGLFSDSMNKKGGYKFNFDQNGTPDKANLDALKNSADNANTDDVMNKANAQGAFNNAQGKFGEITDASRDNINKAQN